MRADRIGLPSGDLGCDAGLAMLEVLIAAIFVAIAITGVAVMLSQGQVNVVAEGDDRVAVALARQKIEAVRALGFPCIPVATTPGASGVPQGVLTGCPDTAESQAARTYNETPPADPYGARYTSRITLVLCADPSTLTKQETCSSPIGGKLIRVELTPHMPQARGIRVETVVTSH